MEMAKQNRVLYVNHPLDRITYLKNENDKLNKERAEVIQGKKKALNREMENLWVYNPKMVVEPVNRIPLKPVFDFFNMINTKRFAREVKTALKELGFKNIIIFNDSSMFLGSSLRKYLNADFYYYYIRDNLVHSIHPYWNTHGKRIERKMIENADAVVTNSLYYTDYAQQYNQNSFMVGQGCDTSLFDYKAREIEIPEDLARIPHPVIGYIGFLTRKRLDLELLASLSAARPEWSIVLIGPEDDVFRNSSLHHLKNVYFLGAKPPETLPNYIKGIDVCINPQVVNLATIGNYPRKIDEYLAMGKPVVATKTKAMEYFRDYTYLATDADDYLRMISKALKENNSEYSEKRREFALEHSWENNLKEIWRAYRIKN